MSAKLGIVILRVEDVARARAFYTGPAGFVVIPEQSSPEFATLSGVDGSLLGLEAGGPERGPAGATVWLGLEVSDVDGIWRAWQSAGVAGLTAPLDQPFGRSFMARDPDGHPLEVYRLGQPQPARA